MKNNNLKTLLDYMIVQQQFQYLSDLVDELLVDCVTELHLAIERVFLVVTDEIDETLERSCSDGE